MSGQCRGSVGVVSGQCRGSVGAVSVDTGVGVSSSVGAVSERCRSSVGQYRGFLTVDLLVQCRECREFRSVGVSGCRGVGRCRGVEVSECRDPTSCSPRDSFEREKSVRLVTLI